MPIVDPEAPLRQEITACSPLVLLSWGCVLLVAAAAPLGAQHYEPLAPGTLVRVSHSDSCCRSPSVGRLVWLSADSVVIEERGTQGARIALRRSSVNALAPRHDVGARALRGAGLGFLSGAAVGVIYIVTYDCQDDALCGSLKPLFAAYTAGIGGAIGLVVGAAIGSQIRHIVWRNVPLPLQVGVGADHRGDAALRLTLRF